MYILIDIGGTNTRVARTDDKESFGEPIIFDTPQHFDDWFALVIKHIDTLRNGEQVRAIVAGMAGTFTSDGTIHKAPHLEAWKNINLKQKLGGWFNCEMVLENDAALVGLGEAVFGSGKGYDIAVYITVSTGVGGIRIVDGKIDRSKFGFEMGHQIINADGKELEYYLAGSSHEKRFNMPSKEIKDKDFWKEVNYYGGIMVANTTMYWSPAVIILGGPVVNDMNLEEIFEHAKKFTPMYETLPVLVKSSLKSLGGLYGGMAYLKNLN